MASAAHPKSMRILLCALLILSGSTAFAQLEVSGTVTSKADGQPLPGVSVNVAGTQIGVSTDLEGHYTIEVPDGNSVLEFSFLGMMTMQVEVGGRNRVDVVMEEDVGNLDQVVVVAFGTQKKSSVVSAITTVTPADLKVPSSNLTTALAGRVPGLIAYQRSGEPGIGTDDTDFFIRGVTSLSYNVPLILIDGVELTVRDLARLQPDDIASFSVLKDASAAALYGARGANGVIYVTTKEGTEGPPRYDVRVESYVSTPTRKIDLADPVTFMLMHNEAVRTRDPLGLLPYSPEKVDQTIAGANPVLYPTNDWYSELLKDYTVNKRMNFSVNGGGKVARYYVSVAGSQDNGILKVPKLNDFNNNIDYKQFQLRSNVNISLTSTTGMKMSFSGNYDDYNGPLYSGAKMYHNIMRSNPVRFRAYYEKDEEHLFANHILFGNHSDGLFMNPYAEMARGYRETGTSKYLAQVELDQNLEFLTEGLAANLKVHANRESGNSLRRFYNPFYYQAGRNAITGEGRLTPLNEEGGTESLDYNETDKFVESATYLEASMTYKHLFAEKYDVSGMLVYTMNNRRFANPGNLIASLPFRNVGLAGRFTFGYDERYFAEFNFGYNASERFHEDFRWGFFPSAGVGWIVSNEDFFASVKPVVSLLKLKATYGQNGNDRIAGEFDRFFYLSLVNLNNDGRSYTTGTDFNNTRPGISIDRYQNNEIAWEIANKMNLGIEIGLFDKLTLEADYFRERRYNIFSRRITSATLGLEADVFANIGETEGSGIDSRLNYNASFGNGMWIQGMANFTYATNKIIEIEEPDYSETPWLSRVGHPINQTWGYVAERLFVDEDEVANSPQQGFGEYMGGDIKYRDINGDGRITGLDRVPIGNTTEPEIIYGFGLSMGYKNVDFSFFFQGLANESFWIDPRATSPFIRYTYNDDDDDILGYTLENQLLQAWADSYWSETNRDVYALWPRLSEQPVENNLQHSSWFMQDGSFLRLKSLEIGYSLPDKLLQRFNIENLRVYLAGTNLMTFSSFKLWDPEMGGNGLGYPTQRVFSAGLQVSL